MEATENVQVNCPEIPDIIQNENSYMDRKIYLAGCALQAHIRNHTNFNATHYPYEEVASKCARWAEAVLAACGA